MKPGGRRRDPIVPAASASGDRTGGAGIRRKSAAAIRARYSALSAAVLGVFDGIRTYGRDDASGRTVYGLTPAEATQMNAAVQRAHDRLIASGADAADTFWWAQFASSASGLGAAQSVANLTGLSAAYAGARTLQTVVFSEDYRVRLALAQIKSLEHWRGLASGSKAALVQAIGRAVADGTAPRIARTQVANAIDAGQGKALQYAQTEITDMIRRARIAESEDAAEIFDFKTVLLWASALTPTTREWHASRHGKTYTASEVTDFYGDGGNLYNCLCSVTETLIAESGEPILSDGLKREMAKQKADWQPKG